MHLRVPQRHQLVGPTPLNPSPHPRQAAFTLSKRSCELAEDLYPPGSPALGLAHLRRAKLAAHCDQLDDAVLAWRRALTILTATHGESAPLVGEAARALQEAELELSIEHGAADDDD